MHVLIQKKANKNENRVASVMSNLVVLWRIEQPSEHVIAMRSNCQMHYNNKQQTWAHTICCFFCLSFNPVLLHRLNVKRKIEIMSTVVIKHDPN